MQQNNKLYEIVISVFLFGFTLFILLDTFVISSVYQTDATAINTDLFATTVTPALNIEKSAKQSAASIKITKPTSGQSRSKPTSKERRESVKITNDPEPTELPESIAKSEIQPIAIRGTWQDDNVAITITEYDFCDTSVYAADIQLSSAQYLKTAFAENKFGKNITQSTSAIAAAHDGILAINGDFYGAQERGYVIRNGIVYRDTPADSDVLSIFADGSMRIIDPDEISAQELAEQGAWQAFSFSPALIEEGIITAGVNAEVGRAMASNPRTAIGIIDDLHYVFIVSDGRTNESEGLSIFELAQFMQQLGVTTAYNLDGGGSSTMVFDGNVINNPTTNGHTFQERSFL